MQYFFIDPLGDLVEDPDWCVLDSPPQGIGSAYYLPAEGERVGAEYPDDARMDMSRKYEGIRLGSLIGNTLGYLIVAAPVKAVIEQHCADVDIEYLPFTLYNLKNRVHSRDYFIVNPIGTVDCLNLEASDVEYLDAPGEPGHGDVVDVHRFVLDPHKLAAAPALFRVREEPRTYVISDTLADAFRAGGFTNIQLEPIAQQEATRADGS